MFKDTILAYIQKRATAAELFPEFINDVSAKHLDMIDIKPFLDELKHTKLEWSNERARTMPNQRNTKHIQLINPKVIDGSDVRHCQDQWFPGLALNNHFKTMDWLFKFAETQNAILQRALIAALAPTSEVYPHIDFGLYFVIRDRYHLVLESEGSEMYWQDLTEIWHSGELHWYNNKKLHHSYNRSSTDRIHLIFDLLPEKNVEYKHLINEVLKGGDTNA
jgi:hypothetical protein